MGNINLYKSSSASGPWRLVQENIQSPVTFDEAESGLTYYAVRDEGSDSDTMASDYKVISEPVYVFGPTDKVNSITFDDSTDLDGLIIKVTSTCGDASNHKVQVQINVKDTGWEDFAQVEIGSDIQAKYTPAEADGLTGGSQIKFRAYIFNTTNVNYRTNNSEEYVYTLGDIGDMNIYIDIPIPSNKNIAKKNFALRKELGRYSSNITKFSYKASLDGDDIFSSDNLENLYLPCLTSDFTIENQEGDVDTIYNKTFNGAKMLVASINIMGTTINKQINIKYIDINTRKEITGDVNFIFTQLDVIGTNVKRLYFNANSIPSNNSYYVIILNTTDVINGEASLYIRTTKANNNFSCISEGVTSTNRLFGNTFKDIARFAITDVRTSSNNRINISFAFSSGMYSAKQMIIVKSSVLTTNSKIESDVVDYS